VTVAITGGGGAGANATALVTPAVTVSSGSSHIYLRNRDVAGTGIFDTVGNTETTIVDVAPGAYPFTVANGNSIQAAISADGSHVAFASTATNLVAVATTAGRQHIYERRSPTSAARPRAPPFWAPPSWSVSSTAALPPPRAMPTARRRRSVPTATGSPLPPSPATSWPATQTASPTFSCMTRPAGGHTKVALVSAPDPSTGLTQGTDPMAVGFKLGSINPTISADGRYVAFASLDNNLTAGDGVGQYLSGGVGATATAPAPVGGAIPNAIVVNTGGVGYTKIAPIVLITGGGGNNAQAVATMSVTGIYVTGGGAGYTSAPTVSITGGGGAGATATATINAGGAVTGLTLGASGAGYTSAPSVTLSGGGGTGATAIVSMSVAGIAVTNAGTGYISAPTVTIFSGGDDNSALDIFVHDRDTAASGTFDTNVSTTLVSDNRFGYQTYNLLGIRAPRPATSIPSSAPMAVSWRSRPTPRTSPVSRSARPICCRSIATMPRHLRDRPPNYRRFSWQRQQSHGDHH